MALDGFKFSLQDRLGDKGGKGVDFYVRDKYSVSILSSSDKYVENSPESMIAEIKYDKLQLLFAVVYRSPQGRAPLYFFNCITSLLHRYDKILITGNSNANQLSHTFPEAITFRKLVD